MPIGVGIIIAVAAFCLFINNLSLRSEIKWAKEHIELLKSANNQLLEKLYNANSEIEKLTCENDDKQAPKIPSFLLADDPMDATLKIVGKVKK